MANDRNPYDHYCMCHGYTEYRCQEMADRIERAKAEQWTEEDRKFWERHCPEEVA